MVRLNTGTFVGTKPFSTVTLGEFLNATTPYEKWRTPLDPRLRSSFIPACLVHIVSCLFVWLMIPGLQEIFLSDFGILFGHFVAASIVYLKWPLIVPAVVGLLLAPALWWSTESLEEGSPIWHRVAFTQVLLASVETFLIGLPILALAVTAAIWLVIVLAVCTAIVIGAFFFIAVASEVV